MVVVDGVGLHQRDDHEAAAERERADLERDPGERRDPSRRDCGERQQAHGDELVAEAAHGELDEPAPEQHEHEPRPDRRRGDAAGGQEERPAHAAA